MDYTVEWIELHINSTGEEPMIRLTLHHAETEVISYAYLSPDDAKKIGWSLMQAANNLEHAFKSFEGAEVA